MSEWIDRKSDQQPVDDSVYVYVKFRDGFCSKFCDRADFWDWVVDNDDSDIVGYRPSKAPDTHKVNG